jgi:LysM repeat protein
VHWSFDAFLAVKTNNGLGREPDFSPGNDLIGGVPLGINIAEDIYKSSSKVGLDGRTIAVPKRSTAPAAVQPYIALNGDTLTGIAASFKVSVADLKLMNPSVSASEEVLPGTKFLVPVVPPAPAKS